MNGRILRIEKLSCYDGDGLRTVVFLKGCPLRCLWCSTPESHHKHTDFGINQERCTQCFNCKDTCPNNAIIFDVEPRRFRTVFKQCDDCGLCVSECLPGARNSYGYSASVENIMREVEKDSLFYMHSGGGLTVSGGEPFMQPEFLRSLLKSCMMIGINTAIETSGYTPYENLEKVLPFVDTLFYDLKHMTDSTHREITGVSNKSILENLLRLDGKHQHLSVIIRMPVIPSINDSMDNITAMGQFCQNLKSLKEIQLLPYHRLGLETYKRLSIPYPLEHIEPCNPESLEKMVSQLSRMGLTVRIGS